MQTYILDVTGREISAASDDTTLVRTSIGVDEVQFRFYSDEWLDFDVSAAFYIDDVLEELPLSLIPASDDWVAVATVEIPSMILEYTGAIGVTVHGVDADGNHIITAESFPLTIEQEGDGIGDPPLPNP